MKWHKGYNFYEAGLVAPLVGAWIEIIMLLMVLLLVLSLLSWERGLKLYSLYDFGKLSFVAPLVGAWIEMPLPFTGVNKLFCRSSRGSVD